MLNCGAAQAQGWLKIRLGGTIAGTAALAALAGMLVTSVGMASLAGVLALVVLAGIMIKPHLGAYLFLIANPLVVGIARGDLLPILRPNELLLAFIIAAFAMRVAFILLSGKSYRPTFGRVDLAFINLALASSIIPLMWRYGRGLTVSTDDILYSLVLWKYFALYRFFRDSVSTPSQVACCLWLSMASASVVAVVAILQVSNLFGVPEFLFTYYDEPFTGYTGPVTGRGTSTLASSFGTADVMVMNLAIAIALLRGNQRGQWLLFAAAGLFLSGCIVAGAFSGFIGLLVAMLAVGFIIGRLHRVLAIGAAGTVVASIVFWPVLAERLAGFQRPSGLPHSWEGRWENLQQFFFPELFSNFNWLMGVRPAPRLPAPEAWRDWVYIESGYVWLLWIGGVPLVAAFIFFVCVWLLHLWRVTRERSDAVAVAAAASLAYLVVIVTLMLFDPHLTGRGSADLFFPLLAMSFVRNQEARRADQAPTCAAEGTRWKPLVLRPGRRSLP